MSTVIDTVQVPGRRFVESLLPDRSDADGVALAAIQGLYQKLTEELKRWDAENAELKRRLDNLEQLLHDSEEKGAE